MFEHMKYFAKGLWVDRYLAQWITTIMIMVNLGLGIAIIAGGPKRFSIPSYTPLIDYVDGETWIWGLAIAFSGVLMSIPFRWLNIIGLWISMVWYIVWMTSFTIAVVQFETAAATPTPVYGGLAMISAALLTARVIDKTRG